MSHRFYQPPPRPRPYGKKRRPPRYGKWLLAFSQILLPLIGFQLLRTLLFPTSFDVFLLAILIVLYYFCQQK